MTTQHLTLQTTTSSEKEIYAWLRLTECPGVGNETIRRLLGAYQSPDAIFESSIFSLKEIVSEKIAYALQTPPNPSLNTLIEKTIQWIQHPEHHVITLGDAAYPKAFLNLYDPPAIIYGMGNLNLLNQPALAIVGTRNASTQGVRDAEEFSFTLAQSGLTIISGLAAGIDAAAHRGALKAFEQNQTGSTIAIIGTGCDIVYPARNRDLAHQIAQHGLILSECPLGTPAKSHHFPRRNRLIAGLSKGVLVIEAAIQSGSLITARLAAEQGLEVFAIPGSIHHPLSRGCHYLIKQGAKLVETAQDIVEELYQINSQINYAPLKNTQKSKNNSSNTFTAPLSLSTPTDIDTNQPNSLLLSHISSIPQDSDALSQISGLDTATLQVELLNLELLGLIERLPGDRYQRIF